jgi:hypothetical protein
MAALTLAAVCFGAPKAHAQARQWLVSGNDNKVQLVDGVSTVQSAPPRDNITLFDIAGGAPRLGDRAGDRER